MHSRVHVRRGLCRIRRREERPARAGTIRGYRAALGRRHKTSSRQSIPGTRNPDDSRGPHCLRGLIQQRSQLTHETEETMLANFSRTAVKLVCFGLVVIGLATLPAAQRSAAQQHAAKRYITPPGSMAQLPFSEAVITGDTVYLAGHIGNDASTGQAPSDLDQ